MPTQEQARQWLDRWDRQQEGYIPDREERFAVIAEVVRASCDRPDPLVVDLGAGPGSLSVRILDRLPGATVVAVDADPLLLGLAAAAYGDRSGLRIVDRDLRRPGWEAALRLDRAADAIVSTTALHWLTLEQLTRRVPQLRGPVGARRGPGQRRPSRRGSAAAGARPADPRGGRGSRPAGGHQPGPKTGTSGGRRSRPPRSWPAWWGSAAPGRSSTRCPTSRRWPITSRRWSRPVSPRSAWSGSRATTGCWSPSAD